MKFADIVGVVTGVLFVLLFALAIAGGIHDYQLTCPTGFVKVKGHGEYVCVQGTKPS